ncbi:hypothetical protein EGJ22_25735 [Pseudomonas sp. p99-361]|nr:hypothetical protein HV87_15500 [Pseudomonas aeruginosa]QDR70909.1 hypothetical protein FPB55_08075 [Pseudomonas sp. BJP69]QEQ90511.1 hypothetical protein F1602_08805 [Pseudomonas putida]RRV01791.1 hypothetical protein EGJ22_25735 [Pseudomonas sp. p99-361]RRV52388.1 hypothetical protein EGJ15_26455 [Pseudomonas sp. p99-361]
MRCRCRLWGLDVATTGLFAGLPAPTGSPHILMLWSTCGSGQAREWAATSNITPGGIPKP